MHSESHLTSPKREKNSQPPERLNVKVLAAICDALDCTPNDLIEVTVSQQQLKARAAGAPEDDGGPPVPDKSARPTRVRLTGQ